MAQLTEQSLPIQENLASNPNLMGIVNDLQIKTTILKRGHFSKINLGRDMRDECNKHSMIVNYTATVTI